MKIKKLLKGFISLLIIASLSLLLFEVCYRFQLIDFYQTEFEYLNKSEKRSTDKTVFILGDSFTASKASYVDQLRNVFPYCDFINTAIPGTGIRQHQLLLEKHHGEKADVLIYQFYIGNDFLDLNYPINFKTTSTAKIIYKKLSEHLLSLHYLNYQLAYFRNNDQKIEQIRKSEFSPQLYNSRQKKLFKAAPDYLQNSIQLKGKQKETYRLWKEKFQIIIDEFGSDKPIYLLVIPHVAQLNQEWLDRMKTVGADLDSTALKLNYPLIKQLKKVFPQVKVINPLPEFQKQAKAGHELYFQNDPHLNANGQKALGEFIVKQLEKELNHDT
jgi:hypothetical protein